MHLCSFQHMRTIGETIFQRSVYINHIISKKLHCTSVLTDNHYTTLGISPKAKPDEIRAAYIKLSKLYHPDKHVGQDSNKFVEISKAYEVLGNSTSRVEYDLREFSHSIDFNRFATGEYKLPNKNDPKHDVSKLRQEVNKSKRTENETKQRQNKLFTISPRIRRLLNYLYFAIFLTGSAMYYLGNKNKSNRNISKKDDAI